MGKKNMNGSVNALAESFRDVIIEAANNVKGGILNEMADMEKRLEKKIDSSIDTTNKNMQAQMATLRKEVKKDIAAAIK